MDSRFYETKLPNHKIFKDLKQSLKDKNCDKLRNLLELKDEILYVWNSNENCLMSLNLRYLEEHAKDTSYQKLHLLSPPAFAVERLMASNCGSRICLWGTRGVTIAELPARWGRSGLFESGNQTVLCKSFCLDERFLYSQAEVRRVHWHPTSLSHVLVLISDNTIRLCNIAVKNGPKLVKVLPIGAKPTGLLAGKTFLDSLGDTAVDFTPLPNSETLVILRGNGDVYMVECALDNKSIHRLTGPLCMYPPADDNYGTDSCCLTALGGRDTPTLLVVATSSAALYHCLLLPNATDKEEAGDSHALYVVEAVELNIVLNPDDEQLQYSYPVHLYPCSVNTYVCVHAGGVHSVTLPLMHHLNELVRADDSDFESSLSSITSSPSIARHLVCTGSASRLAPPVGAALTPPPLATLLLLCDDGTLILRTLEPFDLEEQLYKEIQLKNPALEQDDVNKLLKECQKLSFTSIIQEILTREVSQPILNLNKTEEPSPSECLEVLTQAQVKLRSQYMSHQARARDAIVRKLHSLKALHEHHTAWIEELQKEIDDVQLQSAALRDKCALAEVHQDDLKNRCSLVIRALRGGSAATASERALLATLRTRRSEVDILTQQIANLKLHAANNAAEMKKWREEYKKKDIALGKSHSDTIQSILQQQLEIQRYYWLRHTCNICREATRLWCHRTSQISTLIEETKLLKDQLGVV